jgi:hypothetical protein
MRRLRSRWTVVALVPAFFLASFGLVTALAGGSDDATPAAAEGDGASGSDPPQISVVSPTTTGEAPPDSATTTDSGGTGTQPTTTGGDGGTPTTDGDGDGGTAPPPGTIAVDYGRWKDMFEISETEIVPDFGLATVTGQFSYRGGADCQLGFVELRGRFFSPSGQPVGKGLWESIWVTGNGAEVPQREPLYLEFYGAVSEAPGSARIRFTRVDCL